MIPFSVETLFRHTRIQRTWKIVCADAESASAARDTREEATLGMAADSESCLWFDEPFFRVVTPSMKGARHLYFTRGI